MQSTICFPTQAPINVPRLSGQNRSIYLHLAEGKTITSFQALKLFGALSLHSRISDLRNGFGVTIFDRYVVVKGMNGQNVSIKEYSLKPFAK